MWWVGFERSRTRRMRITVVTSVHTGAPGAVHVSERDSSTEVEALGPRDVSDTKDPHRPRSTPADRSTRMSLPIPTRQGRSFLSPPQSLGMEVRPGSGQTFDTEVTGDGSTRHLAATFVTPRRRSCVLGVRVPDPCLRSIPQDHLLSLRHVLTNCVPTRLSVTLQSHLSSEIRRDSSSSSHGTPPVTPRWSSSGTHL